MNMLNILKILQVESIYFSELWQRIIERLERGDSVRVMGSVERRN